MQKRRKKIRTKRSKNDDGSGGIYFTVFMASERHGILKIQEMCCCMIDA
jgi:hypothetical protein